MGTLALLAKIGGTRFALNYLTHHLPAHITGLAHLRIPYALSSSSSSIVVFGLVLGGLVLPGSRLIVRLPCGYGPGIDAVGCTVGHLPGCGSA